MSSERRTEYVWTCDVCGRSETCSSDQERPYGLGWQQIVVGSLTVTLGNLSAKHLCGDCSESLHLLLSGNLGDAGDMRETRRQALLEEASYFEQTMAKVWGGDSSWLTTGCNIGTLVADVLRERADEIAEVTP